MNDDPKARPRPMSRARTYVAVGGAVLVAMALLSGNIEFAVPVIVGYVLWMFVRDAASRRKNGWR